MFRNDYHDGYDPSQEALQSSDPARAFEFAVVILFGAAPEFGEANTHDKEHESVVVTSTLRDPMIFVLN